jgi:hypothetical protein
MNLQSLNLNLNQMENEKDSYLNLGHWAAFQLGLSRTVHVRPAGPEPIGGHEIDFAAQNGMRLAHGRSGACG